MSDGGGNRKLARWRKKGERSESGAGLGQKRLPCLGRTALSFLKSIVSYDIT